jgi:hypothetical protein
VVNYNALEISSPLLMTIASSFHGLDCPALYFNSSTYPRQLVRDQLVIPVHQGRGINGVYDNVRCRPRVLVGLLPLNVISWSFDSLLQNLYAILICRLFLGIRRAAKFRFED